MLTTPSPWPRLLATLLACAGLIGIATAQTQEKKATPPVEVPAFLIKDAPHNVAELRAMEDHVQKVLAKIMPAVVGISVGPGQGSGVIVSADGLVLTAGHVSGTPNKLARIILPSGKVLQGKTLGRFIDIDSGMIKISEKGSFPHLEMGKSSDLRKGQWVIAIGQPGGFRPNRAPVVRVGRILFANQFIIRTDCALVGGDSGGPLFDMQGRVIGIHSRIGNSINENVHVPIDTYKNNWARLVKGESWGTRIGDSTIVSAGGKIVFEKKDKLSSKDPRDKVQQDSYSKSYTFAMKAGYTYTVDVISDDKSGKRFDPLLRLEDADGTEIAQDDDGGGYPNARIVYKSPRDSVNRIIVSSVQPDQVGGFELLVREADMFRGTVDVLRAVKLPAPAIAKLLEEMAKTQMKISIGINLYNEKGTPQPFKDVTFQWRDGKQTVKSDREGVVRWPVRLDRSKKLTVQIPAGMRAALGLIDQNGDELPPLSVDETVKGAGGEIVKTIDGTLTTKDVIDAKRKKCYAQVHELRMEAGKTYTIDLVSEEFDAYLRVENQERKALKEDDDGGLLNSRIVFRPQNDENFRIVVTTCDPGETGAYRLTIREK